MALPQITSFDSLKTLTRSSILSNYVEIPSNHEPSPFHLEAERIQIFIQNYLDLANSFANIGSWLAKEFANSMQSLGVSI